ncbi:MAG: DNA polymerase I [Oscillospiraceae bacterium]|jgi:DNA polymerase-1|nr:DNA polymerase I [Oscillospiraceae bacterium]
MKILVLDGNSILNRAFYGIKLLTTKDGRFTNAIVGFMNIYLALREQVAPDSVAVAFDRREPTFRHQMYDGYKAQRKGMPPELAAQLEPLKEILRALGLRLLEAPGWEADDILGTLAAACGPEDSCYIATGDRDSLQLVSERVNVLLAQTKMGKPQTSLYRPETILEEYGVPPAELIEIKALMGDASDNIPGVAGVGQKTAQELIRRFHSIDALYANLEDAMLKPAQRLKLAAGKESAALSRTLGTIRTDAPVPTAYADYIPQPADVAKATRLFAELELFALLTRMHFPAPAIPVDEPTAQPLKITEEHDLDALLERCQAAKKAYLLPQLEGGLLEALLVAEGDGVTRAACGTLAFPGFAKALLEDAAVCIHTADSKALHHWCLRNGVALRGLVMDTMLAGYLLNPNASGYSTLRLAQEYGVALPAGEDAAANAAFALPALCTALEDALQKSGQMQLLQDVELPLCGVLAAMEAEGFAVDALRIENFGNELETRIAALTVEIYGQAGVIFNINSPKQLGEVLFVQLGLRPPKKTKTGYSTNAETLEMLRGNHPIIAGILEYRTLTKLKSTYCDGLLKAVGADGRMHSSLNQTETRTGRISSSEPNLQNIPVRTELGRELRRCFIAREGWVLVDADYSQIELRVLAAMAEEETMRRAFADGMDIHAITASQVFGIPPELVTPLMRRRAKAVNFGIVYGIGAFSLANDIGVSFREAEEYIQGYFDHYPRIRRFRAEMIRLAKERGYAETLFGRRRALPELQNTQRQLREFGERVAVNMPIQGTAADIIKIAMVRVAKRLAAEGLRAKLILQVHDELIVEAPAGEAEAAARLLHEEMEAAAADRVPLVAEVHVATDWDSAK